MIDSGKQRLFHTTNLKAATALLTLGFKKLAISRMKRRDNKESIVFWFDAVNADGMSAESIYSWMTAGATDLMSKDPEHVVNYLRAYAHNRDELITDIHATPRMVVIEKDGRRVAISETASDETKRKIAEMI
jgi:hypothetical protein